MKKITLSFNVLAAIIAVTILQACVNTTGTQCVCAKPTLTPTSGSGHAGSTIGVTIATATKGAYLRYTLDGSKPTGGSSGHGTLIPAQSGTVPDVFGRTLKALAYKAGCADSPIAVGYYTVSH
jgi:chitobiase/beta-hexosaminidase-like protein